MEEGGKKSFYFLRIFKFDFTVSGTLWRLQAEVVMARLQSGEDDNDQIIVSMSD